MTNKLLFDACQLAYQVLYSNSFHKDRCIQTLVNDFVHYPREEENAEITESVKDLAWTLALGVFLNETLLDNIIAKFLKGWSMERVGKSEAILLRIGVFNLMALAAPTAIVIDVIVKLAACFNLDDAKNFIGGILNACANSKLEQKFDLPDLHWRAALEQPRDKTV